MTIYALSSGRGRAGVAVFRISGPDAGSIARKLTGRDLPRPREARVSWLYHPDDGTRLDQSLVLWFPGPNSFTGEDVLELHVHGGLAVIASVIRALQAIPGTRPAEPGEFARRAFQNGRFDLTAAEGLADLIEAETEGQRRQALSQMSGMAAGTYDIWRARLTEACAMLEADIDFADEDLPGEVAERAMPAIRETLCSMKQELGRARGGERMRDGFRIAIVGPPNVGKSSLLNTLAKRDVAIVSDRPGTTRDVLEVYLDLGGLPVIMIDTAGLHAASDDIEAEGMRRALERAKTADLRLVMVDARAWPTIPEELISVVDERSLVVVNKTDLAPVDLSAAGGAIGISVHSGSGLDTLLSRLTESAEQGLGTKGQDIPVITRARHRHAVEECVDHLEQFIANRHTGEIELLAEDLRMATRTLARITGRIEVDDILDVIFSEFCIGK